MFYLYRTEVAGSTATKYTRAYTSRYTFDFICENCLISIFPVNKGKKQPENLWANKNFVWTLPISFFFIILVALYTIYGKQLVVFILKEILQFVFIYTRRYTMALTSQKKNKQKMYIKIRFFVAFLDELFTFFFNQIIIFAISKEAVSVER